MTSVNGPTKTPNEELSVKVPAKARAVIDQFLLNDEHVKKISQIFAEEMDKGCSASDHIRKQSCLQMENTFVTHLLDGSESGDFLALDLGGTNFRVLLCQMDGVHCQCLSSNYNIPEEKLRAPAQVVFEHLADSISKFMEENNIKDRKFPLGFTFSFPMIQQSLNRALLVTWTKSFSCPDGKGEEVVNMLEEAIQQRGDIDVDILAVMNDTTGTLMAGSYLDHECYIGMIMGTGSNAAYFEKAERVEKLCHGDQKAAKNVVIDIEWGAFGDNGCLDFLKTEFDKTVDLHSNHRGSFTFEKMFGGHYVGDLARLVVLKLVQEGIMCSGHGSTALETWHSFKARHISHIEKDGADCTQEAVKVFQCLDLPYHEEDLMTLKYLVSVLSIRSAQLVSTCLAVLVKRINKPRCTIAIDGSVYRYHPNMHNLMMSWLNYLAPEHQIRLIDAQDGSGKGAAFVAAAAARHMRDQIQGHFIHNP